MKVLIRPADGLPMNWWKPLAALTVGLLALAVIGSLVGLLRAVAGNVAALAVVALLVVTVLAWSKTGTASLALDSLLGTALRS